MTLTTEDRMELADLVARYAAAVDDRDFAAAAALFTEDAVLAIPSPPDDLRPVVVRDGRAAIAEALHAVEAFTRTQHALVGQVFDGGPGEASGRLAAVAHHLGPDPAGDQVVVTWYLRYLDRYRRTGDGWRFTRRELHLDWVQTYTPDRWQERARRDHA
ncbi:nuclear transport factor 2 family protein [Amycolatopsis viridis]|uniref:Ketosteroid isomerase-like protein n=1 Tax=Amycolatopsis viridis TaxID=185678 RepID=A0ABX0SV26_9PSEU|nr:nuclear transport factor 2 family protein [Amycolatopsis viridis]NIH80821.1 ketosteroid isomerase-like protein [Amycolatopsis viridis]